MTLWIALDKYGDKMWNGESDSRRRIDDVNAVVEFECPFLVGKTEDGGPTLDDRPSSRPYPPEVSNDPNGDVFLDDDDWEPLTGYTGQYGYHGAVMHPSEYFGGRIAADVLAEPGLYVIVEVRDDDMTYPDGDPIGWSVLRFKNQGA